MNFRQPLCDLSLHVSTVTSVTPVKIATSLLNVFIRGSNKAAHVVASARALLYCDIQWLQSSVIEAAPPTITGARAIYVAR